VMAAQTGNRNAIVANLEPYGKNMAEELQFIS
jgi:hypothetical protein